MDFLEPLLTAKESHSADQYTLDKLGASGTELMERAGQATADEVLELISSADPNHQQVVIAIICGPGNNGGDGYVAARRLWQNGIRTLVIALAPLNSLRDEAKIASAHFLAAARNDAWRLSDLSPCLQEVTTGQQVSMLLQQHKPAIVVDAIFGTGLRRPPQDFYKASIVALNKFRTANLGKVHILSVDIPSGMSSDGNMLSDTHVRADSTLAIQYRKVSHLVGPHWLSCGSVKRIDVGISLFDTPKAWALLEKNQPVRSVLYPVHRNFHKGHYGHVGVFLGSNGLHGASILSSYSALRSGAGLVSLLVTKDEDLKQLLPPEIMRHEIAPPLSPDALNRFSAIVLGPGLKEDKLPLAKELMSLALKRHIPMVVDAGALGLLNEVCIGASKRSSIIATPHPGEAGRLLGLSASQIEEDRLNACLALLKISAKWPLDVTWVLKGACPIVAHAKHGIIVSEGGIPTLSIGGSGDVLAGTLGALLPQTDTTFTASLLGVTAHLRAGRNLLNQSSRGFLAHEIADEIKNVLFHNPIKL